MNWDAAVALLDRLHIARNDFCGGGDEGSLRALQSPDVTWIVPGDNSIVGTYRGIGPVLDYFQHRRELAAGSFHMTCRDGPRR